MQSQFSNIGFNGLALDLVNVAEEVTKEEGVVRRLLDWAATLIPDAVTGLFTTPEDETDQFANLPSSPDSQPELLALYIYTDTDIKCATGVTGFVYSALVSE